MVDKNVNIKINVDTSGANSGLSQFGNQAKKAADGISSQLSGAAKSASGVGTSLMPIAGIMAGVLAATQLASAGFEYLKASIADAAAAETSINKLNNTLKLTGSYSEEASKGFIDFADQMEKMSGVSAEAILNQIALSKQLGYSDEQAEQLTTSALKLSTTMGIDFDTAVKQLNASLTGNAGALSKGNAELKNFTKEQLKAGAAVDYFNEKGLAIDQGLQTTEGKLTQANIAFGDIGKAIGTLIIDMPEFGKAINDSTKAFASIVKEIESGQGVFGTLASIVSGTVKIISKVASTVAKSFDTQSVDYMTGQIRMLEQQVKSAQNTGKAGYVFMSPKQIEDTNKKIDEFKKKIADAQKVAENPIDPKDPKEKKKFKNKVDNSAELAEAAKKEQEEINKKNLEALRAGQGEYEALEKSRLDLQNKTQQEIIASKFSFYATLSDADKTNSELFTAGEQEKFNSYLNLYTEQDAARIMQLEAAAAAEGDTEKQKTLTEQVESEKRMALMKKEIDTKKQLSAVGLATANQAISAGLAFAKKGTREQKNLMRAQVLMSTYTAASQALAMPPGPPWTIPLAALVVAQGLGNLRQIDQQQFATGGIFNPGGTSIHGDRVNAKLNSGEMILNRQHQRTLFKSIDNGSYGQTGPMLDALYRIDNTIANKDSNTYMDAEKVNDKLVEIDQRRLVTNA